MRCADAAGNGALPEPIARPFNRQAAQLTAASADCDKGGGTGHISVAGLIRLFEPR